MFTLICKRMDYLVALSFVLTQVILIHGDLELTPVPDGVVLQNRGKARVQSGDVHLFVAIPRNTETLLKGELKDAVKAARNAIDSLERDTIGKSSLKGVSVLNLLRNRLERISPRERVRRGLFDFVGKASGFLFGTATTEDVEAVKAALKQTHEKLTAVIEHQAQIIGFVNHQASELKRLEAKTSELGQRVIQIESWADKITSTVQTFARIVEITAFVSLLETVDEEIVRASWRQQRILDHCQGGMVTEELVPRTFFQDLEYGIKDEQILSDEWYYRSLKVDFYFEQPDSIICKIKIPLINSESFLFHQINTFAVRRGNLTLRILHNLNVAVGTTSGSLFYAENCIGRDPRVCQAGLVFDARQERCARGMITGSSEQKKECPVHVSTIDQTNSLLDAGENVFAVYVKGVEYSYRCPETTSEVGHLDEGLYVVKIDPGCLFDAGDWEIRGMKMHREIYLNFTISLNLPSFSHLSSNWSLQVSESLQLERLQEKHIEDVEELSTFSWTMDTLGAMMEHTDYMVYAISAIIIISVAVVVGCFYSRRSRRHRYAPDSCDGLKAEEAQGGVIACEVPVSGTNSLIGESCSIHNVI